MKQQKSGNHPVIIGIGQTTLREKIREHGFTALDLAKSAIDSCAADTGRPDILTHIDSLTMVNMFSCNINTPVEKLCDKIGIWPGIREETAIGGNNPQWLVNRAADLIAEGKIKTALLAGGEALYYEKKKITPLDILKTTRRLNTETQVVGDRRDGFTGHEVLHGMDHARTIYPLFENAVRSHLESNPEDHKAFLNNYYQKMAAIASKCPHAWFQNGTIPDDITSVSHDNRMIAFPYTKLMNPIPFVNQAAALILTSADTAQKLSIPKEKWVYLHGGMEATDKWFISDRINYHFSPAIRETVQASLEMAGLELADIDFFDLYSCFPCAAVIAALSIGLPAENLPALSITGGLPYFGGPGNNYTMHAIAHTVSRLREIPDQFGLVTGMGWFLTKHAAGVYSGREPDNPWKPMRNGHIQEKIEAMENPPLCERPTGKATVETYTVAHDTKSGDAFPIIIARLDSGERCFATSQPDPALITAMEQEEFIGRQGVVLPGDNSPNIISF